MAASHDAVPGVVLSTVDKVAKWAQSSSIWPFAFGLACCAIEMMSTVAGRFDIARFGAEVFRSSPRQADLMIVAGRVSMKMGPVIKRLYDQMPDPKWVIAMGACASCGGVFNNYAIIQGVDKVIPVDVFVPGCPPNPDALLYSVVKLQEKIRAGEAHPGSRILLPPDADQTIITRRPAFVSAEGMESQENLIGES